MRSRLHSWFSLLEGLVDEIEIEHLRELVEHKQKDLYFKPLVFTMPSARVGLKAHPMFADVPDSEFAPKVRI